MALAGLSVLAAVAWLVSRVWLGLDFADEMQYYGQIASLTRTGRFFQDDLFLQQLGYFFVLPFFKVHAFFFPDQSYLILSGRLLLLAAYGSTGLLFWRAATRLGGFSTAQKLAGLAAFLAWVPFQIFAFSYNTTSYLLIVALVAGWVVREPGKFRRYAVTTAGLLAVLTYTYPPSGLLLILAAVAEAAWRIGRRAALILLGAIAAAGFAGLGLMLVSHGTDFPRDLLDAVNFSRAFGNVGILLNIPYQSAAWLILLGLGGLFTWRIRRGRPLPHPLGAETPLVLRWAALAGLVVGLSALLGLVANWKFAYPTVCLALGLLMVLAVSVGPGDGQPLALRPGSPVLLRWVALIVLAGGLAALFTILLATPYCLTGNFATTVFLTLLIILAATAGPPDGKILTGLAMTGTITGAVFALTSGNGLHNFGVGAAAFIPFLTLYAGRQLQQAGAPAGAVVGPGLALLLLVNGISTPYGEQSIRQAFHPVQGVPAFRGIRTSATKIEAVERFLPLTAGGAMQGRRILMLGPHPWLYFVLGGQPATSVLFMKFDGLPQAYELAAARLFRAGPPDVIVLTTTTLARPIGARYQEWTNQPYHTAVVPLPADFILRYRGQTGYTFNPEVYVLSRPSPHP